MLLYGASRRDHPRNCVNSAGVRFATLHVRMWIAGMSPEAMPTNVFNGPKVVGLSDKVWRRLFRGHPASILLFFGICSLFFLFCFHEFGPADEGSPALPPIPP